MGFLRFLLILIVCYYIFKLLVRFILPLLVNYLFKKSQNNFNKQFGHREEMNKQEGKVTINTPQKNNPKKGSSDKSGEYIDFEEFD